MFYLTLFMTFSILGFLFENIVNIFNSLNSGILNGPWAPLYGFMIFIVRGFNVLIKKIKINKIGEVLIYFVIITIVISVLEHFSGLIIEAIFKEVFWDYSHMSLNIGKYINVWISLIWGTLCTILNYLLYPRLEKSLKLIPSSLIICLSVLFIIDLVMVIIKR